MLGIDTNVLVRFLVRDDQAQFDKARKLIAHEAGADQPVMVSLLVLLETEWVLRSRYELPKEAIVGAFSALLETDDIHFEDESSVEQAIFVWKDSAAEFADCLIGVRNRQLGCNATATFDEKASKLVWFIAA